MSTNTEQPFSFLAEIKSTKQLKKVSTDNEYQLLLVTDNPMIMDLGKLSPDTIVRVSVEVS